MCKYKLTFLWSDKMTDHTCFQIYGLDDWKKEAPDLPPRHLSTAEASAAFKQLRILRI